MTAKKRLKALKKSLKAQIKIAKTNLDNGCFPHDTIKEEAIAKTHHSTLVQVYKELKALEK